MKKIRYILFYPEAEPSSFVKDVGMIPATLRKRYGYDAHLVCYENGLKRPYRSTILNGLRYLRENAESIDILQLFHPIKRNVVWILYFKKKHPDGTVYLKLDADDRIITSVKGKRDLFHSLKRKMIRWLLTSPDLVTVESSEMSRRIEEYYGIRIPVLPNGFELAQNADDQVKKEKIVLTVARNGTYQKATEVLLEAFVNADLQEGWKLRLVGSMEESFVPRMNTFLKEHEAYADRIEYAGEIQDRRMLYKEYERAAVFALPSRYESFGIVLAEALSRGCYLITTDHVPSAYDLIPDERFGEIVRTDCVQSLAKALKKAEKDMKEIESCKGLRMAYAGERFAWDGVCGKLEEYLKCLTGRMN